MSTGTVTWPDHLERIEPISRARTFEVWDCWDHRRISRVVVKSIRPGRDDGEARRQLLAEGRLLISIAHPHIARGYEVSEQPLPHLVMETLGGATLAHSIDELGTLDREETAHLGLQLVAAVGHLHRLGLAHLDLKPSNVIGEAGRARLIDLGMVAPFGPGRSGQGTWSYMAPEQAEGGQLGPATDVWGLGAVLFECRSGHPPFDDPEIEGALSVTETGSGAWAGHHPQLLRRARLTGPRVGQDPELDRLILSCLAPDPDDRPPLATVADGLERLLDLPPAGRRYSKSLGR